MTSVEFRRSVLLLFSLALLGTAATASAQEWTVRPSVLVPVGESQQWFFGGLGQSVAVGFPFDPIPLVWVGAVDLTWLTDRASLPVLLFAARSGLEYELGLSPGLSAIGGGHVGWSFASRGNFSLGVMNPFFAGGVALRLELAPTLAFRAGLEYQTVRELYQGIVVSAAFTLGEERS